jgi:hypothetical protein
MTTSEFSEFKSCDKYMLMENRVGVRPYVVALLGWTSKNRHQKDECYYEIGLYGPNVEIVLGSIFDRIGRANPAAKLVCEVKSLQ